MPRQNDATELFRKLTAFDLFRIQSGTIGDTTTTAAILGDGTEATVGVTAITNFTNGDPVFISGDGGVELNAINGTVATAMPMRYKPKLAQAIGARFVEAVRVPLGKIAEGGVSISPSRSLTAIPSALDDFPIAYIEGPVEVTFSVPLLGYNIPNWQLLLGYAEAETGVGTSADPWQGVIGAVNQTLLGLQAFRLTGSRHDGKTVLVDLLDAKLETSGSIDHNRQAPSVLSVTGRVTKMIVRVYT
jgi:hypothetical protein